MRTVPDINPEKPLKYNALYILMSGKYDIASLYDILGEVREIPKKRKNKGNTDKPKNYKDKYRSIERAIKGLDNEGFAIRREEVMKGNSIIAYYSASPQTLLKTAENVMKEHADLVNGLSTLEKEIKLNHMLGPFIEFKYEKDDPRNQKEMVEIGINGRIKH
jgi:hypothetical protein